jgi:hypothetical protein
MFVGLYPKIVDPPKELWPAHHNLMMMARVQFATEASFERFRVIAEDADIGKTLQAYMELHLFLVSAHPFWTTLYDLSKYLSVLELKQATDSHSFVAKCFDAGATYGAVMSIGRELAPRLRDLMDSLMTSDATPRLLATLRRVRAQGDSEST